MNSSLSSGQHPYSIMPDIASVVSILEQGLLCARRGFFVEAASFFALAHEQLSPYQANHAAVVNAFLQSHSSYWQAQQALHLASKQFVEAEVEQQTRLLAIEKMLPALREETGKSSGFYRLILTRILYHARLYFPSIFALSAYTPSAFRLQVCQKGTCL